MEIDPIYLRSSGVWHIVESSRWGLQLCFILHFNQGLHAKLWAPKVAGIPTLAISRLPFGSPKTNCHLDAGLMERHKIYYKGEGDGFLQVRAMVNLVSPSCSWFVLTPKVLQLCTNHLVLVLCRFVWVVEVCQFLVPSRSSSTPFYPSKVLQARECTLTSYFFVVFNLDSCLSPSRSWERFIKLANISSNQTHEFWWELYNMGPIIL